MARGGIRGSGRGSDSGRRVVGKLQKLRELEAKVRFRPRQPSTRRRQLPYLRSSLGLLLLSRRRRGGHL
jgi:hypothetical protein